MNVDMKSSLKKIRCFLALPDYGTLLYKNHSKYIFSQPNWGDKTLTLGYHLKICSGFTELGDGCFSCRCLGSVTIPEGVVKLGRGAFFECEYLHRVEMPETVTDLESRVFQLCKNLESIKILGVKNIGELAFAGCKKLHTLHCLKLALLMMSMKEAKPGSQGHLRLRILPKK